MKLMLKAITHPNGDLVICGDARLLLFRALVDARTALASEPQAHASVLRTLDAVHKLLGEPDGDVPSATELLGDPERERIARNLLKVQ